MATASFLQPQPQPLHSLEKRCQPKLPLPARYRPYSPALPPAARGGKTKLSYQSKQRAGYPLQLRACYAYPPPQGDQAAYTPSPPRAKLQPSLGQAPYPSPGQPANPAPQAPGQQAYPSSPSPVQAAYTQPPPYQAAYPPPVYPPPPYQAAYPPSQLPGQAIYPPPGHPAYTPPPPPPPVYPPPGQVIYPPPPFYLPPGQPAYPPPPPNNTQGAWERFRAIIDFIRLLFEVEEQATDQYGAPQAPGDEFTDF